MRLITASRAMATEKTSIGELSRLTGVNIETIRYYERIKMLPLPPRTASRRRVYDSTHLRILAFIRRSRELGFTLDEIRALIRLGGPEKASCREVREIAAHTSKTSAPRSATCKSWNACWQKPSPDAPGGWCRIVRCWIFSTPSA